MIRKRSRGWLSGYVLRATLRFSTPMPDAPEPDRRELSSWKEIAAFLAVSVRTAQSWERERGLPVRRLPGGRSLVLASTAELRLWRAGSRLQPPQQSREPRRRGVVPLVVGCVVTVVAALGVLLTFGWGGTPSRWRVDQDTLIVSDDRGRELWRKHFAFPLTNYADFAAKHRTVCWIGDADGDRSVDVIFAIAAKRPITSSTDAVVSYSRTGKEQWRFAPAASAASFPEGSRPPYMVENLAIIPGNGQVRIAVASMHHTYWAAQIALLSGRGELLREYWHGGHIPQLAVADPGVGRPLLFAGGIDNGYARADLVVLDPENFGGVSHEDPAHQLPGGPPREWARILFPQSCISQARAAHNGVMSVHPVGATLEVSVIEEPGTLLSVVVHNFGRLFAYRGASLSSNYVGRHHELETTGILHHQLNAAKEEAELSKLQWLTRPPVSDDR